MRAKRRLYTTVLEKCFQHAFRLDSRILLSSYPYISPYNVGAFLNPLLVSVMAECHLYNLHRGAPLLEKGGTLLSLTLVQQI